jgi:hypothetical protein
LNPRPGFCRPLPGPLGYAAGYVVHEDRRTSEATASSFGHPCRSIPSGTGCCRGAQQGAAEWWILVLWVLSPFIALALAVILAISAKVSSAAAAQQASALVTVPLVLVAYTVASGTLFRTELVAVVIGALAWVGAGLALVRGSRAVQRERLLGVGG